MTPRDAVLAAKAKRHGARYALRIILEARRTGIPISLAFALIEQESGFRNVWGGDPPPNGGTTGRQGKLVTKGGYRTYKQRRGANGRGGMQGVGPAQLTWWEYQDRADKRGGCWHPKHNIRVAFEILAANIKQHGRENGIERYNGSGAAAERYAKQVLWKMRRWQDRLS